MSSGESNVRPAPDRVLVQIAEYVDRYRFESELAFDTAHLCLIDSIGCAFEADRPGARDMHGSQARPRRWR